VNIGLIVYENPISRSYIKVLKDANISTKYLITLNKKSIFPKFISLRQDFKKNNYWPLQFLKQKKYLYLAHQIEDFFNFPRNFCKEMYKFENIYEVSNNIENVNCEDINDERSINIVKKLECYYFLNTGKQILKNIFNTDKKFIHIHPGYLPLIRGADSSLWHINQNNNLGVSSFFMDRKIDEGLILARENLKMPKFILKDFDKLDIKTLYRLWFSFFDPLLRSWHLKKILNKELLSLENVQQINVQGDKSNYFSFMNEKQLKDTFVKVFNN